MDWDLISFVKGSKYREIFILALAEREMTPTELKSRGHCSISYASFILGQMKARGLVIELTTTRRHKILALSEKGRDVHRSLKKLSP